MTEIKELRLNESNYKCRVNGISYLGGKLFTDGKEIDQNRMRTITNTPTPQNKEDVLKILGMYNFEGKDIPNLAQETKAANLALSVSVFK